MTQDDGSSNSDVNVSRRDFAALSVAAGLAVGASAGEARAAMAVTETDVTVKTADGDCDAVFIHPAAGAHPGVIIWTDIFGLRPSFRGIGRRVAELGYSVLVPNPFYRTAKAPVVVNAHNFVFSDPANRTKIASWTGPMNAPGAIERDAMAHVAFLDAQKEVDTSKPIGTQGYCMGGPLVFKTCATVPDRVRAGITFHGGGLVTDKPDSPHLLAPKIKARMYCAVSGSDDIKQPDAKDKLRAAFAAAHVDAVVEVYTGTIHGWCVPDMPLQDGKPIYDKAEADRAFTHLVSLYKEVLA